MAFQRGGTQKDTYREAAKSAGGLWIRKEYMRDHVLLAAGWCGGTIADARSLPTGQSLNADALYSVSKYYLPHPLDMQKPEWT